MGERVVGQHRQPRIVGQVAHRHHVEVIDVAGRIGRPLARGGVATALGRSAELLQHGQFGVTATGLGEQPGQRGGAGAVAAQHDGLAAAPHRRVQFQRSSG